MAFGPDLKLEQSMSAAEEMADRTLPRSGLNWLFEVVTMFVVAVASLSLLLYMGFGDGQRTFEQIYIEKCTSNGILVRDSIEKFLRDGLPLQQYAGFSTLVAPILEAEEVDALAVYDTAGHQLFIGIDKSKPTLPDPPEALEHLGKDIQVIKEATAYQIVIPLRTRFETIGSVVVISPKSLVNQRIAKGFLPLVYLVLALSALFAVGVVMGKPYLARFGSRYLQVAYGCAFLVMAICVVMTSSDCTSTASLGRPKRRLSSWPSDLLISSISSLVLKILPALILTFEKYRRLNPEISEAALLLDQSREITTNPANKGRTWKSDATNFEYKVDLGKPELGRPASFAISVPKSVIFGRVFGSVKNFAALFIASAFLAGLLLQVAGSAQGFRNRDAPDAKSVSSDMGLVLIKPVFFLSVFLDALTYTFLPKLMQQVAVASGYSIGFASVPFTTYYLCFALSLIPAGTLCERRGSKPVIILGLLLAGSSVLCLGLPLGLWGMTALRGVAGIGQGMLLIGVQSFILNVAPPEKKTQGVAIIVFGFQAGLLSGMALGALLVNFLSMAGVFVIAGAVGVVTLVYTLVLVPRSEANQRQDGLRVAVGKLVNDLKNVSTDREFLNTLLCIGMPAKAILTGVITFAIPLVLGQAGYRSEDIGEIVMLYGLGVVVSNAYICPLVDRTKNTEKILMIGAVASGVGLALIGLTGSSFLGDDILRTAVIVFAVGLIGIAHGFVNAPVVTHIVGSPLAKDLGATPVSTVYRFLERGGHVAGPVIMSQLFLIWGQGPQVLGGVGVVVAILGVIFVARRLQPPAHALKGEPAE